jgi:glycosyltransferase involved in cell wall biosynthesis
MRKLNILILVDKFDYHGSYINGPTRNYSWLLKRLDKNRFNVFLYALRAKGKSSAIFKQEGIEVTYLDLGKYNPLTLFVIIGIMWRNKIDILHLQGYGSVVFGQIAGIIYRKPRIVKEEWVDPNISKLKSIFEHFLSVFATRAIAISEYARNFLIAKKGMNGNKIVLIPNGIPLDDFRNVDDKVGRYRRRQLNIPDDFKVIGIVGMLHENKGHKYFIEAASLVSERKPKTKFLIIGDGELRNELQRQVSELQLGDHVIFMGHQTNMPELLQMLDVFVMASISETWPTCLMEAMAAKRAIVTTDSGGGGEIVKDGETGIVVSVRDSKAIAEKIEYLIDNPSQGIFLAENAQKESARYDINLTVQRIQKLYEETLMSSTY